MLYCSTSNIVTYMEPADKMELNNLVAANTSFASGRTVYKGVYKCGKKFKAQIQIDRVQHYLGLFDSEIEAAVAYDNHARIILGARARTNFAYNDSITIPEESSGGATLTVTNVTTSSPSAKKKRGYAGLNSRIQWDQQPSKECDGSSNDDDETKLKKARIGDHQNPPHGELVAGNSPQHSSIRRSKGETVTASTSVSSLPLPPAVVTNANTGSRALPTPMTVSCEVSNDEEDVADHHRRGEAVDDAFERTEADVDAGSALNRLAQVAAATAEGAVGAAATAPTAVGSTAAASSAPGGSTVSPHPQQPPPPSVTAATARSPTSTSRHASPSHRQRSPTARTSPPQKRSPRRAEKTHVTMQYLPAPGYNSGLCGGMQPQSGVGSYVPLSSSSSSSSLQARSALLPPAPLPPSLLPPPIVTAFPSSSYRPPSPTRANTYWAGVLFRDALTGAQVWKGSFVSCPIGSLAKPLPAEFALSTNLFEFTMVAASMSDNGGPAMAGLGSLGGAAVSLPVSGIMVGAYRQVDAASGQLATFRDRDFILSFHPVGEAGDTSAPRLYAAFGRGYGVHGPFTMSGSYSPLSGVLELLRTYP